MRIEKLSFPGIASNLMPQLELMATGKPVLKAGTVAFPKGLRHPEKGFGEHEEHEISFIVTGALMLETPEGQRTIKAGDLIHLSPGEPHAATALENSKVFYVLFG